MAVGTTENRIQYSFSTGDAAFTFPYAFFDDSDLRVDMLVGGVENTLVLGVDYEITPLYGGYSNGGVVTLTDPIYSGTLTITRDIPLLQQTDYQDYSNFPADVFEDSLDKLTMLIQQAASQVSRSITIPASDPDTINLVLPAVAGRASQWLGFDAAGDVLVGAPIDGSLPVSTFMQMVLESVDAEDARNNLYVGIEKWSTSVAYAAGSLVAYSNNIYKALQASTSKIPSAETTYWSLLEDKIKLCTGSSYNADPLEAETLLINSTTNPYPVYLPAASGTGRHLHIFNINSAIAGIVRIYPNGTDRIGPAGNVSIFLQNTDQGGNINYFQHVRLVDALSGQWVVTEGQFCPDQSVDTDGAQYHLGKLHHLPLGNGTSRRVGNLTPAAVGNWYASAITGSGVFGVPSGAKGLRARVRLFLYSSGAGNAELCVCFSDNNSSTPTYTSAHPNASLGFYASGAAQYPVTSVEIDIPLNSSGQFYMYTLTGTLMTLATCVVDIMATGYYMGD